MQPVLITCYKFSVDWKLMWSTLFLIMRINVGCGELLWPIVIGPVSVRGGLLAVKKSIETL